MLLCLLLALLSASSAWAGDLLVDVIDVGQGDGILIRSPAGKAVLIDAGDSSDGVLRYLRAEGVEKLSLVAATHGHADHIGGMAAVLASLDIGLYLDNGVAHSTNTYNNVMRTVEAQGIPYKTAAAGMTFTMDDGVRIEVLHPPVQQLRGTRSDQNANSVVMRVTHGDDCLLFTGDAEADTERTLLANKIGHCDVLKVAHHGSGYATSASWLAAVKPSIALISVGKDNSYGHPHPDTMARLQAAGVEVHRTDLEGTLRVVSTGHGVTVGTAPTQRAVVEVVAPTSLDADCPYAGSASSEVFHESTCGHVGRVAPANRVCYASREAALAAAKRPGGCCHP